MDSKYKPPEEWFKQADYDLETAETLFKSGKYIYTVFMCHLSIEKALKGLYAKKFKKYPPKNLLKQYKKNRVKKALSQTKELLLWLKEKL
jgi:HEPN domain-containing protein